jgi:hypothetical protein
MHLLCKTAIRRPSAVSTLIFLLLLLLQVRIRGVAVGSVLNVKPSLDKVDVLVEVRNNNITAATAMLVESCSSRNGCVGGLSDVYGCFAQLSCR